MLAAYLLLTLHLCAQSAADIPLKPASAHARDVKVLKEYDDGKGNMVRTIQYEEGKNKITETIYVPIHPMVVKKIPIDPDTLNRDSLMIVVNKGKYDLELFYRKKLIRSYKAVFGPKPLEDKCVEGDRCTPEGWFKIAAKNAVSKYHKFLLLDYPNEGSVEKFNKLKAAGKLPANAKMGGDVGIHGIWKGGDDMIAMGVGWTDGCIAINNADIDDLFALVSVGTRVYVRK